MKSVAEILRWRMRNHPDWEALCHGERRQSYRTLHSRTNQLANALIGIGVRKHDRVGVLDKGHDRLVETIFALSKAGAVYTPINWRLATPEISQILNNAEVSLLFIGREFEGIVADLQAASPKLRFIINYDGSASEWTAYEAFLAGADDNDPENDTNPEDTTWQVYTSGTTGLPKGVEITHENIISMCTSSDLDYDGEDNVVLACLPFFHIGGAGSMLSSFFRGARIVVTREVDPAEILDLIEKERITHALFVPALLNILLQQPAIEKRDFSSLKTIIYGASPISEDLLEQSLSIFGSKFVQAYGLTETTGSVATLMSWEHQGGRKKLRSCGLPVFGHRVRIVSKDGTECDTGQVGEVLVSGANVMKGYWKNPEDTAKTIKNGWLHTGDAGYVDKDGFLYISDRIKDMIISGGENVYPAEVEKLLFAHPDVVDVAVIGVPDDRWGEAVKAFVVSAQGSCVKESDIIRFCVDKIAGYKRPNSVEFVAELPRNPSGKILKNELRAAYWANQGRNVN